MTEPRHTDEQRIAELEETVSLYEGMKEGVSQRIAELEAEVERLREVLEELMFGVDDYWASTEEGIAVLAQARTALNQKELPDAAS